MMTKNNQELVELMERLGFHQTKGKHGRNPTGNWSGKQNQRGRATTIIKEDTQKILNEVKKSELRGAFTNMEWVIETLKRSGHDDESIAIYEKINKDNVKRINVLEQEGK